MSEMETERGGTDRSHWPPGVNAISWNNIGKLGVGSDERLYWNGREVQVRKRITLSSWQALGTILIVLGTVIGGLGAAAQGWAAAHQWSCQIKLTTWHCPQAAAIP